MGGARPKASPPVVDVLDAHDVVFPEIAPRLHLDKLQVDLAGIGETVIGADRQIDRLVLVHEPFGAVERHFGRAFHHDPMFGAVAVSLHREPPAGPNDYALDLIAGAAVDALV